MIFVALSPLRAVEHRNSEPLALVYLNLIYRISEPASSENLKDRSVVGSYDHRVFVTYFIYSFLRLGDRTTYLLFFSSGFTLFDFSFALMGTFDQKFRYPSHLLLQDSNYAIHRSTLLISYYSNGDICIPYLRLIGKSES